MTRYEPLEPTSVYWPKAGDEGTAIEGVYEEREAGKFSEVVVVRTPHGIRKVNASARVQAVLSQMKIGARYRFTYGGTITLASGQSIKDIKVARVRDDADSPGDPGEAPAQAPADDKVRF